MNDRNLLDLDPRLRVKAVQFLQNCNNDPLFIEAGAKAFITQTYRGKEEQDADYAKGRTMPGEIVTNAEYGQSPHNCTDDDDNFSARAFDFGILLKTGACDWNPADPLWCRAIVIGEALELESGSTWCGKLKDSPHFELKNWQD